VGPAVVDRSGQQLPYVPRNQYSLTLDWQHPSGIKARLQADTWGEYYLDNANSEKYSGYDFITSLNVSYAKGPHTVSANVQNLSDKRYAVEVKKDARGSKSYTPGAPRSLLVSYRYAF
jgi:iron complex outermembrane receptor protein